MMADHGESLTKTWIETWARAGPKLEEIRRRELREMSYEDRTKAMADLFQIGPLLGKPREASGLVEQQRQFQKARQ